MSQKEDNSFQQVKKKKTKELNVCKRLRHAKIGYASKIKTAPRSQGLVKEWWNGDFKKWKNILVKELWSIPTITLRRSTINFMMKILSLRHRSSVSINLIKIELPTLITLSSKTWLMTRPRWSSTVNQLSGTTLNLKLATIYLQAPTTTSLMNTRLRALRSTSAWTKTWQRDSLMDYWTI